MPNEPLSSGDDLLILQLLDIVAQRLHQLLTQGIILEGPEMIQQTQLKIDRLRQQLDRLRIVLRKQKESEQRKRKLGKQAAWHSKSHWAQPNLIRPTHRELENPRGKHIYIYKTLPIKFFDLYISFSLGNSVNIPFSSHWVYMSIEILITTLFNDYYKLNCYRDVL